MNTKTNAFLGKLLPANEDIQIILGNIREKYNLPEIELGEGTIEDYLVQDVDFQAIYDEIEQELHSAGGFIPKGMETFYAAYRVNKIPQVDDLDGSPQHVINSFQQIVEMLMNLWTPAFMQLDGMIKQITEHTFIYLLTGEAVEISEDWFSLVASTSLFGEPVTMAIASSGSDLKSITEQFKAQHRQTFGKQPKITKGRLNTADLLRMKYEGKSIADIADNYILRNPSEFPKDPRSKTYKEAKAKLEERIKKSMQRLDDTFTQIIGDKK
ncbi:MAG: hypothetical protein HND51_16470 [Chloroflexi bacterium]|nr:hypothetical protein [Chloroflexota bacterium]